MCLFMWPWEKPGTVVVSHGQMIVVVEAFVQADRHSLLNLKPAPASVGLFTHSATPGGAEGGEAAKAGTAGAKPPHKAPGKGWVTGC
jgi:hypothetical protein